MDPKSTKRRQITQIRNQWKWRNSNQKRKKTKKRENREKTKEREKREKT